jgi:hypothetical protein
MPSFSSERVTATCRVLAVRSTVVVRLRHRRRPRVRLPHGVERLAAVLTASCLAFIDYISCTVYYVFVKRPTDVVVVHGTDGPPRGVSASAKTEHLHGGHLRRIALAVLSVLEPPCVCALNQLM